MALPILDGNQSATTLSTILSSGQHITAHTVVSLGTQAITDIVNATSAGLTNTQLRASAVTVGGTVTVGNSVTVGSLPAISGTVTANSTAQKYFSISAVTANRSIIGYSSSGGNQFTEWNGAVDAQVLISGSYWANGNPAPVSVANSVTISSLPAISGTVTANVFGQNQTNFFQEAIPVDNYGNTRGNAENDLIVPVQITNDSGTLNANNPLPISGTVTVGNTVTISGTVTANPTGTQTIAGSVTLGASTAQIGSVTASISGIATVNLVALPALVAGTAQIGSVTASISNSVTIGSLPAISGTVTANVFGQNANNVGVNLQIPVISFDEEISVASVPYVVPVQISNADGAIGSNNSLPIRGTVTVGNSVTIASLPAISGTVTANLAISSTAITSGSFTSLTSATLVPGNVARKMATVYNLGAGQLFINAGATATTLGGGFMVALSSGDFYECDYTTTTLSAIFATAGTASWVSH